ncbi:MAG: sensor domain-containing diguanylate cyclase [Desulfomonilia bacterium]|jgi:diguanylate cyclase (GGDEF)-like protein/PAS domain S-box-containing protein
MDLNLEALAQILSPYIALRDKAEIVYVSDDLARRTGMIKEDIRNFLQENLGNCEEGGARYHTVSLPTEGCDSFECILTSTTISGTEVLAFSEPGGGALPAHDLCIPETLVAMAQYSPSAYLIVEKGVIVYANDAFYRLTRHSSPELVGRQLIGMVSRQSREAFIRACEEGFCSPEGMIPPGDLMLTSSQGRRIFVSMKGGWLRQESRAYLWLILGDVTEQVKLMRRIKEQEERFADLFDISPIGMLYVNPRGIITSCNLFVSNLMGHPKNEIHGSLFTKFVAPREVQRLRKEFHALFVEGRGIKGKECVLRTKSGEDLTVQYDVQVISRKGHNIQALMVFSDITEKKRLELELLEKNAEMEKTLWEMAEVKDELEARAGELNRATEELKYLNEKLNQLSITDGLTGIYNHRHFQDRLSEEVQRVQRVKNGALSLLLLDIDDFKRYNDTYGHQCGDMVLRQLAALIRKNIRSIDTLARYGGEEFAVILPNTHTREAVEVAERICMAVRSTPFVLGEDISVKVTVSIGVGSLVRGQTDKSELISRADNALYAAKAKWKDRVEVWEEE